MLNVSKPTFDHAEAMFDVADQSSTALKGRGSGRALTLTAYKRVSAPG